MNLIYCLVLVILITTISLKHATGFVYDEIDEASVMAAGGNRQWIPYNVKWFAKRARGHSARKAKLQFQRSDLQ